MVRLESPTYVCSQRQPELGRPILIVLPAENQLDLLRTVAMLVQYDLHCFAHSRHARIVAQSLVGAVEPVQCRGDIQQLRPQREKLKFQGIRGIHGKDPYRDNLAEGLWEGTYCG
jgi:hypothetical protein